MRTEAVIAIVAIGVSAVAAAVYLAGPAGKSPSGGGGEDSSDPIPEIPHTTSANVTNDGRGTGIIVALRSATELQVESHWANVGYWNDTRFTVIKEVQAYNTTRRGVLAASVGANVQTSCRSSDGDSTTIKMGIRSCPRRDVRRTSRGSFKVSLGPGTEFWYAAAFGADHADLNLEIHASGPFEVVWSQTTSTRLDVLYENRTQTGAPAGGPRYLAHESWNATEPTFAEFVIGGEYGSEPNYTARGEGRRFGFTRDFPAYQNRKGQDVWLPAFPAETGNYTLHVEGGRRSPEPGAGEVGGVALAQLEDPRFLTEDAWLPVIGE